MTDSGWFVEEGHSARPSTRSNAVAELRRGRREKATSPYIVERLTDGVGYGSPPVSSRGDCHLAHNLMYALGSRLRTASSMARARARAVTARFAVRSSLTLVNSLVVVDRPMLSNADADSSANTADSCRSCRRVLLPWAASTTSFACRRHISRSTTNRSTTSSALSISLIAHLSSAEVCVLNSPLRLLPKRY